VSSSGPSGPAPSSTDSLRFAPLRGAKEEPS
jgi:hypothetical protein